MTKMTVNRAQRRKLETRQKLLDTAARLLSTESYEKLTVKGITEAADVGYGTFYLHFTDKDDIVWQVTESLIIEGNKLFQTQFAHLPPLEREFESLKLWFEIAKYNKKNILTVLGRNGSQSLSARYKDAIVASQVENLRRIAQHKSPPSVPIGFAANFFTGAVLRLTAWWLENDIDYTPQQMAEYYFQLLENWGKLIGMEDTN